MENYEEIEIIENRNDNGTSNNNNNNTKNNNNNNTVNGRNISLTKAIVHTENVEKFSSDQQKIMPESNFPNSVNVESNTLNQTSKEKLGRMDSGALMKFTDFEDGMLTRPEFRSNIFKNIPVRPRRGVENFMENYCLFDPSIDFCSEKEAKDSLANTGISNPMNQFLFSGQDDQFGCDVLEGTRETTLFHNYYVIDPDLLEEDENRFEELETVRPSLNQSKKPKLYCNTLTSSSSSSQSSTSKSVQSSSSDYPSMFNSVIETTHSSTIESTTDENDSSGKPTPKTPHNILPGEGMYPRLNYQTTPLTNHSILKKKSPQIDKIFRHTTTLQTADKMRHSKPTIKSNIPSYNTNKRPLLDPMRSSYSLPQLQEITVDNCWNEQATAGQFGFDKSKEYYFQDGRLSNNSDVDSGFLSLITSPDPVSNNKVQTDNLGNRNENVQEIIKVSFFFEF